MFTIGTSHADEMDLGAFNYVHLLPYQSILRMLTCGIFKRVWHGGQVVVCLSLSALLGATPMSC